MNEAVTEEVLDDASDEAAEEVTGKAEDTTFSDLANDEDESDAPESEASDSTGSDGEAAEEETPDSAEPEVPVEEEPKAEPEVPQKQEEVKPVHPPEVEAPSEPHPAETPVPPQPPEAQASELTAEEWAEKRLEARQKAQEEIAANYALSEEDAEAMVTEPEKVLPKLAAQLYLDVFDAVVAQTQNMFPSMLQQHSEYQRNVQQAEEAFYEAWPQLKDPQYAEGVNRLAVLYRQANPQADMDQFIREVGVQAMVAHKLPIDGVPGTQAPAVQPASPPPPRPAGSRPAAVSAPSQSDNVFTMLAEELDEEDR